MSGKENATLKLTPAQERVLGYIGVQTALHGQVAVSKSELAKLQNCSTKTIDRAIARLRQEGLIEVEERYLENGGQSVNIYRLSAAE